MPSCDVGDNNREISYDQPWLKYAIPSSKNGFESCVYYARNNSFAENESQCSRELFNKSNEIKCTEFIYKTDEINVQTEVNKCHCRWETVETFFFFFFCENIIYLGKMEV